MILLALFFTACGQSQPTKVIYLDDQGHRIETREDATGILLRKSSVGPQFDTLLMRVYESGTLIDEQTLSFTSHTLYMIKPGNYIIHFQAPIPGAYCDTTLSVVVLPHNVTDLAVVLQCPRTEDSGIGMDITAVTNVPTWYFISSTDAPAGVTSSSGLLKVLKFEILQDMVDARSINSLQFVMEYTLNQAPVISYCNLAIDGAVYNSLGVLNDWYSDESWGHSVASTSDFLLPVLPQGVLAELFCYFESIPPQTSIRFGITSLGAEGNFRVGNWLQGNYLFVP